MSRKSKKYLFGGAAAPAPAPLAILTSSECFQYKTKTGWGNFGEENDSIVKSNIYKGILIDSNDINDYFKYGHNENSDNNGIVVPSNSNDRSSKKNVQDPSSISTNHHSPTNEPTQKKNPTYYYWQTSYYQIISSYICGTKKTLSESYEYSRKSISRNGNYSYIK